MTAAAEAARIDAEGVASSGQPGSHGVVRQRIDGRHRLRGVAGTVLMVLVFAWAFPGSCPHIAFCPYRT